jgi:cobalt-zinc-cadmium efflux system outer membrane protein
MQNVCSEMGSSRLATYAPKLRNMECGQSIAVALAGMVIAAGCATIRPAEGFRDVRESLGERTDRAVGDAVAAMLGAELSVDQAVQVALLNNRSLQAIYEDLGVAQADVVQAGLLRNPVFELTVRWPDESPHSANVEVAVVQDFLDVFFIPARKQVAAAQFEAAQRRVAHEVLRLAADVREAFYDLQAAQHARDVMRDLVIATEAAAEAARRLRAAGNITELALARHEAADAQARLELMSNDAQVTVARERLARLMGVSGGSLPWTVAARLPELPSSEPPTGDVETLAVARRLDVQAARRDAVALADASQLANATRYLSEAEIGADAERETEGTWLVGPRVSAPLPLFDQGQASLARARAQARRAHQRHLAADNDARAEVRTAVAQLAAARARAEHFTRVVLPLRARVIEQAQLEYNGMLIGVFELLETKRAQIEAQRQYVDALRAYWVARSELERAAGGRLPEGHAPPATVPATAPAAQPQPDHQHHH